ncbi:hypothetical protein BX667DRAFT_500631 [Coemansia mojavensis]|nr:hypothetical protein BX667DRAFT_500631 [Coemansia mojavensis]
MSTITMTTALQPLCLLSAAETPSTKKTAETEQQAVNLLADKLYACNLEPTKSSVSTKLVFDKDALCDDGPYVHLSMESIKPPSKRTSFSSSSLLHMQPKSNPFKTMMRAEPTPSLSAPHTRQHPEKICIHCKQGNFLEFCFSADRCSCGCHNECPCKPCLDIRQTRSRKVAVREISRRLAPLDGLPTDACDAAPITRHRSQS